MLTKDTAICIRALDYSETSQIVTFFTRAAGKIGAIAKGAKRPKSPFDGPLEILSYGKIVFSDSNKEKLAILTEFEQQPTFAGLAGNLFALNCSLLTAELLNKLTDEHDPHPQLFDSFLQFLKNISQQPANRQRRDSLTLLILFELTLLREAGLQPVLNACVSCKNGSNSNWPQSFFSSSAHGFLCRDCEGGFADKIGLTAPAANALSNLKVIANTDEKVLNEIEKVLIYHFTEITRRPPRMAKYVL